MSSSDWVIGLRASPNDGAAAAAAATRTGESFGASVDPVGVAASLATAARSPATTRLVGRCSRPRMWNSPCSRSSVPRGGVDQAVVDGDRAGQHLEQRDLADELVGDGLEHVGERLARRVRRHLDVHRRGAAAGGDGRRPVGGRWSELADEVGEPVDADAGGRRSDEHGELGALEHLVGERALQLGRRGHLAGQVALELLVVAGDDLLDELVVQPVLLVGDVGRDRLGVVLAVGLVLEALIGEHVGDAVELLLLAEREARAARSPTRTHAFRSSSTLWKSARGLSSLLTKTRRGMPRSAHLFHASSVPTSTPSTALTTTTARSATASAASTSPAKSV